MRVSQVLKHDEARGQFYARYKDYKQKNLWWIRFWWLFREPKLHGSTWLELASIYIKHAHSAITSWKYDKVDVKENRLWHSQLGNVKNVRITTNIQIADFSEYRVVGGKCFCDLGRTWIGQQKKASIDKWEAWFGNSCVKRSYSIMYRTLNR